MCERMGHARDDRATLRCQVTFTKNKKSHGLNCNEPVLIYTESQDKANCSYSLAGRKNTRGDEIRGKRVTKG